MAGSSKNGVAVQGLPASGGVEVKAVARRPDAGCRAYQDTEVCGILFDAIEALTRDEIPLGKAGKLAALMGTYIRGAQARRDIQAVHEKATAIRAAQLVADADAEAERAAEIAALESRLRELRGDR